MVPWRFIDTCPLDGAANMAVDEALLTCFDPGKSRPVFRIYGWEPPALSLGRFQKARDILDPQRCIAADLTVVRRITGGGVIYHADELTYSIVCSPSHLPSAASIKESFRVLTSFLLNFYRKLGLDPAYAIDSLPEGTGVGERSTFCFAGKESYDILIKGKKIGGNAQRRLKNVIFQHGSIPLVNRSAFGAGFLREPPVGIGETTGALRDFGVALSLETLSKLLADAFLESHGNVLEKGNLSVKECAAVDTLTRKHSALDWVWEGMENREKHENRPQA